MTKFTWFEYAHIFCQHTIVIFVKDVAMLFASFGFVNFYNDAEDVHIMQVMTV